MASDYDLRLARYEKQSQIERDVEAEVDFHVAHPTVC